MLCARWFRSAGPSTIELGWWRGARSECVPHHLERRCLTEEERVDARHEGRRVEPVPHHVEDADSGARVRGAVGDLQQVQRSVEASLDGLSLARNQSLRMCGIPLISTASSGLIFTLSVPTPGFHTTGLEVIHVSFFRPIYFWAPATAVV
jgi:hypothetical protein